jgi:hypothetical protein
MDREPILRHAEGLTARAACSRFSGINKRISKDKPLACKEYSLLLGAESFNR